MFLLVLKNIKGQNFSRIFVHEIYVCVDSILMLLLLSLFINLLLSLFIDLLLLLFDNSSQEDIKQQPTSTLINITTSTPMKHKGAHSWVQEAMMAAAAVPPLF